jgi:hypothetical protein
MREPTEIRLVEGERWQGQRGLSAGALPCEVNGIEMLMSKKSDTITEILEKGERKEVSG